MRLSVLSSILLFALWKQTCRLTSAASVGYPRNLNHVVLMVSLDGFGWDYMKKTDTPNLDYIVETGVEAAYLRSSFPTTTYPNHFTLVTGLYPESHGIVANYMYDPKFNEKFNIYNTDPKWWGSFGAEPLWITNQKQGGRSGVIHWPAYNVKFDGQRPDFNVLTPSFNIDLRNESGKVISYKKRIDFVTKWLTSEKPPNFVALYFEEPDEEGHAHGPDSDAIKRKIREMDRTVGQLLQRLRDLDLLDRINLIVTSDHGMTGISSWKQVFIDNFIDPKTYDIWDASTNLMISPHNGKEEEIYEKLQNVPHVKVYRKKDIPQNLHFSHNRRIPKLLVLAEEGWSIVRGKNHATQGDYWVGGNHGFSNEYKSMRGFFIGRGPAFNKGYKSKGLDNVHVYPLICRLLGVQHRPNNGSLAETIDMLKSGF